MLYESLICGYQDSSSTCLYCVFWWMSVVSVCLTCAYCHLQVQQCCCFISRYHWVLIVSLITAALYDLHIHDALKTQQFNSTILVDLILKLNG